MAVVDQVATILNNNYTYTLEEAYNKWRHIAKERGLIKASSYLGQTYSPINTKEDVLSPKVIKELLGNIPIGMKYFFQRGIFQETEVFGQQKCCIFCQIESG